VPAIQGELNPAAWMLEITTPGMEHQLGVDFAQVYKESELARCALYHVFGSHCLLHVLIVRLVSFM